MTSVDSSDSTIRDEFRRLVAVLESAGRSALLKTVIAPAALGIAVVAFMAAGWSRGVRYPAFVWNIPIGAALAVVGALVRRASSPPDALPADRLLQCAASSCAAVGFLALLAGYLRREWFRLPAGLLTLLAVAYEAALHVRAWRRVARGEAGRLDILGDALALVGHALVAITWWEWFVLGYPGVALTFRLIGR